MMLGKKLKALFVGWISILCRLCVAETSSFLDIADDPFSNNGYWGDFFPIHLTDGDFSNQVAHSGDNVLSYFMVDLMVERTIKSVYISNRGFNNNSKRIVGS